MNSMKNQWSYRRILSAVLSALMVLNLCACGSVKPAVDEAESSSLPDVGSSEVTPSSELAESSDEAGASEALVQSDRLYSEIQTPIEPQKSEPKYNYAGSVPETTAVDDSYFDDAVFIGDSRTQGLIFYNSMSNTTAYMDKGLKVDTAFTKSNIDVNGVQLSAMDALAQNHSFSKVYVMLGVNELGWAYSSIFIEKYGELVDTIKIINPDAKIYIQSILPVSASKSNSDQIYNMKRINEYNDLIRTMTEEKQVYYLNVAEAVADGNGYLPEEATTDGVHLNKEYCIRWLDYLKSHTVV